MLPLPLSIGTLPQFHRAAAPTAVAPQPDFRCRVAVFQVHHWPGSPEYAPLPNPAPPAGEVEMIDSLSMVKLQHYFNGSL